MALYDDFPYTNFHSLNLDWIVRKLSELENGESSEESSSTATLARNLSGNYPYTNFHALNLDWVIRSMFELESGFETVENEWQGLRATGLLNDEVKNAILQCFENVAWVNEHGQQYYNTLRDLFFPPVIVDTLTAVLDQGERVFHTGEDVNVIKDYLTVTAKLTDGTLVTVPSTQYILTGSLSQDGPNIIAVSYMNTSTTITVNAVAVSLVSISAVYTQSGTVYDTDSLDSLKSDLVVTAIYDDSSTATVSGLDYTLSGTLAVGTSTITVTYEGLTTTFNVTVTQTREDIFGEIENGVVVAKITSTAIYPDYVPFAYVSNNNTTTRACFKAPIENKNYVFTVTDSTKYSINAVDVTSLEQLSIPNQSPNVNPYKIGYRCGSKTVGWNTTDSVTTPYVWIALKKNDDTAFTSAELANGAEAVFTYTESE